MAEPGFDPCRVCLLLISEQCDRPPHPPVLQIGPRLLTQVEEGGRGRGKVKRGEKAPADIIRG